MTPAEAKEALVELYEGLTDEQIDDVQRGVVAMLDLGRKYVAGDPLDVPSTGNVLLDAIGLTSDAADSVAAKREALERARRALDIVAALAVDAGQIAGKAALAAAKEQWG